MNVSLNIHLFFYFKYIRCIATRFYYFSASRGDNKQLSFYDLQPEVYRVELLIIMLHTAMEHFLETLAINDKQLYHRASNVRQISPTNAAFRDLLLVTFRQLPQ
ncbi:2OG-Fe dioxygenase family protein [Xenorhabdus doucetiae]|uniref:2OG-Fe dioxygenase family protein n=1 Tax=Xenorhabdus doucetiae TaxID=351671 RepID=UPI002B4029F9|nr:2OG-Fe dioxygenase family protein [Xenorhabdus sp. 18]